MSSQMTAVPRQRREPLPRDRPRGCIGPQPAARTGQQPRYSMVTRRRDGARAVGV